VIGSALGTDQPAEINQAQSVNTQLKY
jgi:hypothetical protein